MTHARGTLVGLLTLAAASLTPITLYAQDSDTRKPIEIGIDAALTYDSNDNGTDATSLTLPVPVLRIGFLLGSGISLEPSMALRYTRVTFEDPRTGEEETLSGTSYDLTLGMLFPFNSDRARSQPFLRPFVGVAGFSGDNNSRSQISLGGALGVKIPVAERVGMRVEAGYTHALENEPEVPASKRLFLSFGLSFFTR